MAIGTIAAIGLGLAGTGMIAGAVAANKASKNAVNAQVQNTENTNALYADIYNQNQATLSPHVQSGNLAGSQLNALLGLGGDAGQAQAAFNTWRGATGYQNALTEGVGALDASAASRGALRSGAAERSKMQYGTNLANNTLGQYMGYLGNQQGVGLAAASAQAGVSQNYANNVAASNQSAADAISNGALMRGSNTSQLFGSLGGLAGNALGRFGSSFGK